MCEEINYDEIHYDRRRFLGLAVSAIATVPFGLIACSKAASGKTTPAVPLPIKGETKIEGEIEGDFPSLGGATAWLNSPPLTASALRGKVVLIDFWTIPASTGDAHFLMSVRGPRNTGIKDWW